MDNIRVTVGGLMSVDGKIAPADRVGRKFSRFMTRRHQRMLHTIRSKVDAIVVGVNTVIADNPSLTVREVKGKNPLRVVLDSNARTPLESKILDRDASTVIAVTKHAPEGRVELLRRKVEVLVLGGSQRVDLKELLGELKKRGIHSVLVEGGGEVRWGFFKEGLVDELFVWVVPYIWGGRDAPTLVDGEGFLQEANAIPLKLKSTKVVDKTLILAFRVNGNHV
ncbi:MAG: 2,5-diamino-6-(ribosylamino)-4(3H)-pyrimidinone 5'-phosphate reductase [Candidatus Bathyarchaeia archaeon]